MQNPRGRRLVRLALLLGVLPLTGLAAQSPADTTSPGPTTRIAPGPQYDTGWLHRLFFGERYRDLWSTPIEAPVLDMDSFAGGLKVTRRGGGQQTNSLRLEGADGKEYQFRSLDKDPVQALPPALRSTAAADVVRDQTSAGHPVGALLAPPILEAAGVLHASPRIAMLPKDDPRLGEFATEFGGMLGTIEERPGDAEGSSFAGASDVISTTKLLKEIEDSPNDRVDARAFLTARLVDILIGDWDRHADQWRWARFGDARPRVWLPIPRDRDQAFARFDGLLLTVARASAPQLVNFGPSYAGMLGQTWNGRDLDRQLLVPLERPVWDSVAAALQSRLTDAVIESAAARLPPSYVPLDSARLVGALRKRRDGLREAATRYYRHLAGEVDVHGTDRPEVAEVHRADDRFTDVSLAIVNETGEADEPYFRRRFDHEDTKEVRLILHNGADRVRVGGEGRGGVRVRVLPGKGADRVVDSSRGSKLAMYTEEEIDSVLPGGEVSVSRAPYAPRDTAVRDWGDRWLSVTWLAAGPDIGIFAGTGVSLTRYGFRRDPYAERYRLRAGWSTGASTGRADFNARWIPESSRLRAELLARASGIDVLRFHGLGNEVSADGPDEFYRVEQLDLTLMPSLTLPVGSAGEVSVGPRLRYSSTDFDEDRFLTPLTYGAGNFGMLGAVAGFRRETRDKPLGATRGLTLRLGGGYFPSVLDVEESFGELHAEASTFVAAPALPLEPTLAFRAGGKRVWGRFPFQEAAFIGDASTVRLGRQNRYGGDASVYAGSELRLFLTRFYFLAPADFGILGLADVGRVFLDGESSDRWHAAGGGGVWASFLDRSYMVSLSLAKSSERTGLYLRIGSGF
ncbi:hypothetical protein BH24GEM1_BH24GEM1_17670 [soil metagenome]